MPIKWRGKEGRDRNCDRDCLRDLEREGELRERATDRRNWRLLIENVERQKVR